MREQGGKETLAKYKQRIYITAHNIFNMTKKLLPQSKQVAPKATNKTKITSNKAQPKKMNKNWKQPAPDDESSSDEAPETPHGYSRKKAKKVTKEEIDIEDDEVEEISQNNDTENEADKVKFYIVSDAFSCVCRAHSLL